MKSNINQRWTISSIHALTTFFESRLSRDLGDPLDCLPLIFMPSVEQKWYVFKKQKWCTVLLFNKNRNYIYIYITPLSKTEMIHTLLQTFIKNRIVLHVARTHNQHQ